MLTEDPDLIKWFNPPGLRCDRMRGFFCGYNGTAGMDRNFMRSPEYKRGWDEGKALRFDELTAALERKLRAKK